MDQIRETKRSKGRLWATEYIHTYIHTYTHNLIFVRQSCVTRGAKCACRLLPWFQPRWHLEQEDNFPKWISLELHAGKTSPTVSSHSELRSPLPSNQPAPQKLQPPKSLAKAPDIELALWVFSAAFVHQPRQGPALRPSFRPPAKKQNHRSLASRANLQVWRSGLLLRIAFFPCDHYICEQLPATTTAVSKVDMKAIARDQTPTQKLRPNNIIPHGVDEAGKPYNQLIGP